MKLLRAGKAGHVFHFGSREKQLLLDTVKLYPLVPASRHRLSQDGEGANADGNQRLLEEALAEHRMENRRQVLALLNETQRFRETNSGFELTLTTAQIQWLLQVLNDVRVGSWLALGEPEPGKEPEVTEPNFRYLIAMELGGMFESALLAALGMSESRSWGDD